MQYRLCQPYWHKYGRADRIQQNTDANKSQVFYIHVVCKVSANIRTDFFEKRMKV